MNAELQELLTHSLVAVACMYLAYRAWKRVKSKKSSCSSGGHCACKKKDVSFRP